ncbi:MAG: glycosyltransferase family 4 protein [Proteobacteria bacterium]|nr:glycosyltransferase family 4 protein [Pseudomonadota bacterium]
MNLIADVSLFLGVLGAAFAATFMVLGFLRRRSLLDHPNPRSSHAVPTPRGGGIAVLGVLIPVWAALGLGQGRMDVVFVCAAAAALAGLSWFDDLAGLAPPWRLLGHGVAVGAALAFMTGPGPYFGGLLPPALDPLAAGLLWLWFVNLFNFMDGIDGIAGVETACLGAGAAVVALIAGLDLHPFGLTAAAAALGFLWWNRPPARIFLGDVGSVPLGFLLGWLLLSLAASGQWAAALILPLYYLADATITLLLRVLRGETVWQAHHQHFYQRAVGRGLGHAAVTGAVLAAGAALVGLAAAAAWGWTWQAVAGAAAVVAALLFHLGREGKPAAAPR